MIYSYVYACKCSYIGNNLQNNILKSIGFRLKGPGKVQSVFYDYNEIPYQGFVCLKGSVELSESYWNIRLSGTNFLNVSKYLISKWGFYYYSSFENPIYTLLVHILTYSYGHIPKNGLPQREYRKLGANRPYPTIYVMFWIENRKNAKQISVRENRKGIAMKKSTLVTTKRLTGTIYSYILLNATEKNLWKDFSHSFFRNFWIFRLQLILLVLRIIDILDF